MHNLLEVQSIKKIFKKNKSQDLLVLDDVNFSVKPGEIVALLGRSGCGKSTMLRIMAGLIQPSSGKVLYQGAEILAPAQGIAMVFQHFALMPWLTVLQNVELGLEALGVERVERRQRALKAIDMIGLDGFESAFPKELSGGMRQRVGIARAMVVEPNILLMDEPFSALDVLTADNLRSDLLDLWAHDKYQNKSIVLVTHNIEEAIFLADRAIIFDSNPGTIQGVLKIDLTHPRDYQDVKFRNLVDDVYSIMTTTISKPGEITVAAATSVLDLNYRFPDADISELIGLLENIDELQQLQPGKPIDLPHLADELSMDIDDLLPLTEVLNILKFAKEAKGDIRLTETGKHIVTADILTRKQIFARHLLLSVPHIKYIYQKLKSQSDHCINKKYFIQRFEKYFSADEAERVLKIMIQWGRYAELFAYDDQDGEFSLENPQ